MSDKLRESIQYLKNCSFVENESFKLYETLSKKINQPESSFILGIGYDSLKNSKLIQGILDSFEITEEDNKNMVKNLSELAADITSLQRKISKINNLEYLVSCEMLKESINLEALLCEVYSNFLKSSSVKTVVDELSKGGLVNLDNFKKVFESFIEEKSRHKTTLVETMYLLEAKETETRRQITPIVKYQNPDAWIHESTIHSFATVPAAGTPEQ
jgi:hypothetical protein